MTERTESTDVETLVGLFVSHQRIPTYKGLGQRCVGCDHLEGATDGPNSPRVAQHIAELVLTSDWLATRDASIAAEAESRGRAQRMDYAAVKGYELGYSEGARQALLDAADALEGGLGVFGIPQTLYDTRVWLRARAAVSVSGPGERS